MARLSERILGLRARFSKLNGNAKIDIKCERCGETYGQHSAFECSPTGGDYRTDGFVPVLTDKQKDPIVRKRVRKVKPIRKQGLLESLV